MTTLLSALFSNLWPYLVAAIGGLALIIQQRRSAARAERDRILAKQADAYEKHLKDIADAANARPTGDILSDSNNRDTR